MAVPQSFVRSGAFPPNHSHQVDVELLTFIERYVTNLVRWDVLVFFGQSPSARDNSVAVARQLGRRPHVVEKEMDDLAYLGVLRAYADGKGIIYELEHRPAMRRVVMRLARYAQARAQGLAAARD